MSYVHAFSCIHTFLFFLFNIIVDWYSSTCLSFSLSDSLRMAPKRKTTLSRNPLRSGAYSSVDPTPLHIRFRDEKAQLDFSENFSSCGIHSERQVILSDFSDTDLPTIIYSRGWKSLYDIPVSCPTMIIQEFYSNMHNFDYSMPRFIIHV